MGRNACRPRAPRRGGATQPGTARVVSSTAAWRATIGRCSGDCPTPAGSAPTNLQSWVMALVLYTIGHSNRPLEDFLALLDAHAVRGIADVRAFPSSRRWPHFNREPLAEALRAHGVTYDWIPQLG